MSVEFLPSNYGINQQNKSHPIAIVNGYRYRWKDDNKNSTRYVCINPKCYASLTLKGDQVIKLRGLHYHAPLTDLHVSIVKATQDLKKEVYEINDKSVTQCYRDFVTDLVNNGVSDREIAVRVPTMKKISSCLIKIRAKNNEKEPEDF